MQEPHDNPRAISWPFLGVSALLILFFGFLMFTQLDARPMHNDEGVNAWFLGNLIKSNNWRYDPTNYHGPSLYYIQLVVSWVNAFFADPGHFQFGSEAGITERSIRTGVVLASLLTLALVLLTVNRLGRWGAVTALVLLGTSLDYLFYSRYFIHEIFLVLFTLGMYVGATQYLDTKKAPWFFLVSASAAFLFTTKETCVLIFFVMIAAAAGAELLYFALQRFDAPSPLREMKTTVINLFQELVDVLWVGLLIGIVIWSFLFTSFFTNVSGLIDSFGTYLTWTKTGVDSGHNKPFPYFLTDLLLFYEKPILFMAFVGTLAALFTRSKKGLYLVCWSAGILLVHSAIPYKTPWIVLNMILPLALLGGFGVQCLLAQVRTGVDKQMFVSATAVVLLSAAVLLAQQFPKTLKIVYVEYDNEKHKQVYVHTSRQIYDLLKEVDRVAAASHEGKDLIINIVSTVEWPLPFYLRHYPRAYFWRQYENISDLEAPLIIAEVSQRDGLMKLLKKKYTRKEYLLRNGLPLELYIREDMR